MSAANANLTRRLLDAALIKTKVLPAAGAANFTDSIDLGSKVLGPVADFLELELFIPATPALVDAKTIILTAKDSADNATFAAIPALGILTQTGAGGAGAGAAVLRVRLPASTRRYLRLDAAVLAAGGDNTAVSYGFRLLVNS